MAPAVSQRGFTAIAYVFKFLWRQLVRDIHTVYR